MQHKAAQANEDGGTGSIKPDFSDRMVESLSSQSPTPPNRTSLAASWPRRFVPHGRQFLED
jgi:hypothetical protein